MSLRENPFCWALDIQKYSGFSVIQIIATNMVSKIDKSTDYPINKLLILNT